MVRTSNTIEIDLSEALKSYLKDLPPKHVYFQAQTLQGKMSLASLYEQAARLGVLNQRCYTLSCGEWVEVPRWK